jgi:C4-dicarboxylate-binding protein DctP
MFQTNDFQGSFFMSTKLKKALAVALSALIVIGIAGCEKSSRINGTRQPSSGHSSKRDLSAYALSIATPLSAGDLALNYAGTSNNPKKIIWRHGSTGRNIDEHPNERAMRCFFIEMKRRLGDRIEIQVYPNASLGSSADQILGGLQARSFESYAYNVGAFAEYTNAFLPLDVMFIVPDLAAGIAICNGEPGDIMRQKCIDDTGLNVLFYPSIGMRHITNSKRAIRSPKDMSGLKIRVQNNPLHIMAMSRIGAAPTPIAYAELFTSLQQKVVDGQENPVSNIFDQNFGEVQSYMTLMNHMYTAGAFVINNSWLLEQDPEFRQAVRESVAAAIAYSEIETAKVEEQLLRELGSQMEITVLTDEQFAVFRELSMQTWSQAAKRIGEDYFNRVKTAMDKILAAMPQT